MRKLSGIAVASLLMCSALYVTAGADVLIEDFEDGWRQDPSDSVRSTLGEQFVYTTMSQEYTDYSSGVWSLSVDAVGSTIRNGSDGVVDDNTANSLQENGMLHAKLSSLHATSTINSGEVYVGLTLPILGETSYYNLSTMTGFQFKAKGSGLLRVSFVTRDLADSGWGYYSDTILLSSTLSTYTILPANLRPSLDLGGTAPTWRWNHTGAGDAVSKVVFEPAKMGYAYPKTAIKDSIELFIDDITLLGIDGPTTFGFTPAAMGSLYPPSFWDTVGTDTAIDLTADTIVDSGASITLTARSIGSPAPTYQWQHLVGSTWTPVGTATNTYTIAAMNTAQSGQYRLIATNLKGTDTSSAGLIGLPAAPVITSFTVSKNPVDQDSLVTFTVTATGVPAPWFEWMRDGSPIDNSGDSSVFTFTVLANDSGGAYSVVAINDVGTPVQSAEIILNVNKSPIVATLNPASFGTPKVARNQTATGVVFSLNHPLYHDFSVQVISPAGRTVYSAFGRSHCTWTVKGNARPAAGTYLVVTEVKTPEGAMGFRSVSRMSIQH